MNGNLNADSESKEEKKGQKRKRDKREKGQVLNANEVEREDRDTS